MKKENSKFVISILISLISISYLGLAFSYAWFFSNRSEKNTTDNLKIVSFEGQILTYNGNNYDENGGNPKGFQGEQFLDTDKDITTNFKVPTSSIFQMTDILPKVRFLYLFKLRHNFESEITANFYINAYTSSFGTPVDAEKRPCNRDDPNNIYPISLSEAINIYVGVKALTLNQSGDLANFINSRKKENDNFHRGSDGSISYNYAISMDTGYGRKPLLNGVSIPPSNSKNEYYYIPLMFEFSDDPETYYTKDTGKEAGPYDYIHATTGNSNVYKNMTFEITNFEVTPYTK